MMRGQLPSWMLLAVLLTALGCTEEPVGERYTARLSRSNKISWKLESVVNPQPQSAPGNVIWEVTRYPDAQPTARQQRAADSLVKRVRASANRNGWFEYEKGVASGYSLLKGGMGSHYVNYDYIMDDRFLDPERPEFLMYYDTPNGKKLVGYMFMVPIDEEGAQIGGPLTVWHYHLWSGPWCILKGRVYMGRATNGLCSEGEPSRKSPEMLHVWLVDHPRGRFASKMSLPPALLKRLGKLGSD